MNVTTKTIKDSHYEKVIFETLRQNGAIEKDAKLINESPTRTATNWAISSAKAKHIATIILTQLKREYCYINFYESDGDLSDDAYSIFQLLSHENNKNIYIKKEASWGRP